MPRSWKHNRLTVLSLLHANSAPLPAAWTIDEANNACFIVRDGTGQALGYFYFEDGPGRRSAAKLLTHDEARRQLAQVPDLTQRLDSGAEARQHSLDIAAQGRRSPLKSKTSAP